MRFRFSKIVIFHFFFFPLPPISLRRLYGYCETQIICTFHHNIYFSFSFILATSAFSFSFSSVYHMLANEWRLSYCTICVCGDVLFIFFCFFVDYFAIEPMKWFVVMWFFSPPSIPHTSSHLSHKKWIHGKNISDEFSIVFTLFAGNGEHETKWN